MKLEPFLQPTIRAFHGFLLLGAVMEDAFSQHRKTHHGLYWRKSHTAVFSYVDKESKAVTYVLVQRNVFQAHS